MEKVKTSSGFEIELAEETMNNMELLDALADLSAGDGIQLCRIIPMVLGKEGKKSLYEHLRLPDGRVPADAVDREVGEILKALQAGKNSSSSPD